MTKVKLMIIAQANGGVSEYLKNFIKYIDKKKYEINIILSEQYKLEKDEFIDLGCNLYFINMIREINLKADFLSICDIKKTVNYINPDIIFAHSSKAGVLVRLAISHKKIPIVYNAHGWAFNMKASNIKRKMYACIERICAFNTSKIVCISDYEKSSALKFKICKENKLITINNGIDLNKINRTTRRYALQKMGLPENAVVIGQVGRLDEQKNPLLFIDIAKELIDMGSDVYFILVGDGKLRKEVNDRINNYNLGNRVHITGWCNNVNEYISCFNIGMLTSKWEGFGLALVEYMALGVPVVASNIDGIPNVVDNGETGILCESEHKNEFIKAINEILNNKELAKELSKNGMEIAKKRFSMERVVKEHNELFDSIIGNV